MCSATEKGNKYRILIYKKRQKSWVSHQHSKEQHLDLGVSEHLLIQQHIGLRHRNLAQMGVGYSLCFCKGTGQHWAILFTL